MAYWTTRVVNDGIFWRVEFLNCGVWQRDRNLYLNRYAARLAARNYC